MVNRRDLLALMGAAALTQGPARAAVTPVIEWNMHMFSADVAKFPFHPNAVYKPDASKLPAAAGSVGFPNAFYKTDAARPAAEGAVQ